MKLNKSLIVFLLVLVGSIAVAQEMTKEQWQNEMNRYRTQVNDLTAKLSTLNRDIADGQAQSAKLDTDLNKCLDELYALVGSDRDAAAAYRAEVEAAENKANELLRLSDAELLSRSGEVDALEASSKAFWANKLSLIPEFWDRLTALDDKIKSLRNTISGSGKTYTVGTWARNRDCLWNIAKKRDIYGDAWLWPKIWQGNRSQISDPDVIHPGQKLRIPAKARLTTEEKSAANSYYRGK